MHQRAALAGAAVETGAAVTERVDRRHRWTLAAAVAAVMLSLGLAALAASAPGVHPADSAAKPGSASSSAGTWAQLSPAVRLAISRGVGADEPSYWARRSGPNLL